MWPSLLMLQNAEWQIAWSLLFFTGIPIMRVPLTCMYISSAHHLIGKLKKHNDLLEQVAQLLFICDPKQKLRFSAPQ